MEQEDGASAIHSAEDRLKVPLWVVLKFQPRDDDIVSV